MDTPTFRRLRKGEAIPTNSPRRYTTNDGYVLLRWKLKPGVYVEALEHRIGADGRIVNAAHVHHRNHNRQDNRPENLEYLTSAEHRAAHRTINRELIKEFYEGGMSTPEVAAVVGCDASAVWRALNDMGVETRGFVEAWKVRRDEPRRDKVVELFLGGMSPVAIGKYFGWSDTPIRRILKEEGVPSRRTGRPRVRPPLVDS